MVSWIPLCLLILSPSPFPFCPILILSATIFVLWTRWNASAAIHANEILACYAWCMNYNQERQPCVYGLRAGSFYGYVGSTRVNSKTRLWEHRARARKGHTAPVYDWMREVGIDNVEIVELDDDPTTETKWIDNLLSEGHPLRNQLGLDGNPHSWSKDMKRKVGDANRGKPTWIKGKRGEEAGWTQERRRAQSERFRRGDK
jgi:hypothetical protein